MGWPISKKFRRCGTREETNRVRDEKRRLRILNLCTQCKVEPRSSTMTICKECNCERRKKDFQIEKVKKMMKKAELFGGRCVRCQSLLTSPLTRNNMIRYLCDSCYKWVWDEYRRTYAERPYLTIHRLIMQFKIDHGILPENVWRSVPRTNSWSRR